MTFWNVDNLQLQEFRPGVNSKAAIGKSLIMVCMEIAAGKEDTGHDHVFDQCGMVIAGKIEMFVGDERKILAAHESYFIPAGIRHGWKTFDKAVKLLDICPPQTAV
ncbi:MAG: cupin domain-containing protein [Proteobacteria bacterium]|nr:cupin domain-containing protein [Pseudomonadota bacterium]